MRDADLVRITLTLDDDILEAARKLSEVRGIPIGAVISALARCGLASACREATRKQLLQQTD
jgi:hypothetical protein